MTNQGTQAWQVFLRPSFSHTIAANPSAYNVVVIPLQGLETMDGTNYMHFLPRSFMPCGNISIQEL